MGHKQWRAAWLAAACAIGLMAAAPKPPGITPPGSTVDARRIIAAEGNAEWLSYGRTYSEQRFSPLDQVNGALSAGGMAAFKRFMSPDETESIRAYLLDALRTAQKR